ncbi:MAG: hypothetical protein RLZZ262_775 [Bacteroidota bacterium]|jgi:hypothetical protein
MFIKIIIYVNLSISNYYARLVLDIYPLHHRIFAATFTEGPKPCVCIQLNSNALQN